MDKYERQGEVRDDATSFVADDWRGPNAVAATPQPTERRSRSTANVARRAALEHDRAAALIGRAHSLLRDQFAAIRRGGEPDVAALQAISRDMSQSMRRNRFALVGLTRLRSRHEYTYVHSIGVGALMIGLARELALPEAEIQTLGLAGLLHDIGKASVPLDVLDKPGPLSSEEWATIKTHPELGHALLTRVGGMHAMVLDVCLHHHERLDGSGYPDRLTGDRISLAARIGAVCDVYDALTSRRAYKDSQPAAQALAWMQSSRGHFDPALLQRFARLIGTFPAGTLVRLERGRLAVVLDEPALDPINPRVRAFYCTTRRAAVPPVLCDTGRDPIIAIERPADWGFVDWDKRCETLMAKPEMADHRPPLS